MKHKIGHYSFELTVDEIKTLNDIETMLNKKSVDRSEFRQAAKHIFDLDQQKYLNGSAFQNYLSDRKKIADRRAELNKQKGIKAAKWVKKYAQPGMIVKLKGTRDGQNRKIETVEAEQLICRKLKSPFEVTTHQHDKVEAYYDKVLKKMVKI